MQGKDANDAADANTFGVPCTFCMSLYVVGLRQVFWVVAS